MSYILLISVSLGWQSSVISASTIAQTDFPDDAVHAAYASLPLVFEPNVGQADSSIGYLTHHGRATTYFRGTDVVTVIGDHQVTMRLDNTAAPVIFTPVDQLPSITNYFIGSDATEWHANIPNYQRLIAKNIYPSIDLTYYGTNTALEYDFVVKPGGDPGQITLHFDGAQPVLDAEGNLVFKFSDTEIRFKAPITYQMIAGRQQIIASHFALQENSVVFVLDGTYDHSQPLIIDPTLIYSTYLGGSASDTAYAVVVDANGNAYVTGQTASTNFPTSSAFQGSSGGGADVFVTKFNQAGSALTYSTYLGGSSGDLARSIALDFDGNAYITGNTTSTNFPTSSPFQGSNNGGGGDAFVTKLNTTGSALTYSTYLGGTASDYGYSIAVDTSNSAYVGGDTTSTNFPTASAFQGSAGGNGDVFVTKFNAAGSALTYSTYLGGSLLDNAQGIAVDTSGNAYVTGQVASTNFPTSSPFQGSNGGGASDTYVTKFNAAGSALTYSTYLGGSGSDNGTAIAVDSSGNAYVTGYTGSSNFPTSSAYQGSFGGSLFDAFVTKFNAAGSALTYSTYLGGSGLDFGFDVAADENGNAYIIGYTASTNFPTASAFQGTAGGSNDAFVTKFNAAGSALTYSTYLGGSGGDLANGLAVGLDGDVYVVGNTASSDFPTTSAFQGALSGTDDAFLTVLSEKTLTVSALVNPTLTFTVDSTACNLGTLTASTTGSCSHTMTAATNGTNGYSISYIASLTLTSGAGDTIDPMTGAANTSTQGTEEFGLNLRDNATPNVGADPSGGVGSATDPYDDVDEYVFDTAGAQVASSGGAPSATTTFTVSYIANVSSTTEAGAYTKTQTYNITANY